MGCGPGGARGRASVLAGRGAVDGGSKGGPVAGVRISGHLDLEAATLRCPLSLDSCYVDASEPVCLEQATVTGLALTRCHLAGLRGDMLSAREVDLTSSMLTGPLLMRAAEVTGQVLCRAAHRNSLKHAGALPGQDAVDDVRASVTAFFDENTPRVFAVDFAAIDMTYVVPQEGARDRLRAAAAAESADNRVEAMAQLAEAFGELFPPYGRAYGSYAFGDTVHEQSGFPIGVESAMTALATGNNRRGVIAVGGKVDKRIRELTNAVAAMQRGMRVLALGIDYGRYDRFQRLTPRVYGQGEHRRVQKDADYAPTSEEYDFCVQFVVAVSLRIAEVEANAVPVSWRARWLS
jgi:hypothetical protein